MVLLELCYLGILKSPPDTLAKDRGDGRRTLNTEHQLARQLCEFSQVLKAED